MKCDEAVRYFDAGYNCAQAVLAPFAQERGLEERTAHLLASAFGGGMARTQGTCGAVTGGLMALGLHRGFSEAVDPEGRAAILEVGKRLVGDFVARFGTLSCRELLDCDLNTEEGRRKHQDERQRELICRRCVEAAAEAVEGILG